MTRPDRSTHWSREIGSPGVPPIEAIEGLSATSVDPATLTANQPLGVPARSPIVFSGPSAFKVAASNRRRLSTPALLNTMYPDAEYRKPGSPPLSVSRWSKAWTTTGASRPSIDAARMRAGSVSPLTNRKCRPSGNHWGFEDRSVDWEPQRLAARFADEPDSQTSSGPDAEQNPVWSPRAMGPRARSLGNRLHRTAGNRHAFESTGREERHIPPVRRPERIHRVLSTPVTSSACGIGEPSLQQPAHGHPTSSRHRRASCRLARARNHAQTPR